MQTITLDKTSIQNNKKEITLKQLITANNKVIKLLKEHNINLWELVLEDKISSIVFVFKPEWSNKDLSVNYALSNLSLFINTPRSIASAFLENKVTAIQFVEKQVK